LMYSFGSVSAVGSWFCISVTRRVRKSLAEIVAESELAELELALELLVLLVALACGRAAAGWRACPAWACCRIDDNTDIAFRLSDAGKLALDVRPSRRCISRSICWPVEPCCSKTRRPRSTGESRVFPHFEPEWNSIRPESSRCPNSPIRFVR
jgi:hypothetical protein